MTLAVAPDAADTVFYIQASATVGMGHLARSAALVEALDRRGTDSRVLLRVDDQGRALARDKGLTAREVGTSVPARVIIDAVNLPEEDARTLWQSPERILVSPVCDRPEIATHALLRAVPDGLRERLAHDCTVIEDKRFAYATATGLPPRSLDFAGPLIVGICLSGGADQPKIGDLLHAARSAPGVDAVHVIHPDTPDIAGVGPPVYHRSFCNDPWVVFGSVNVFVTGDGLMVAEALAQGLPYLSITRSGAPAKNRGLVDIGCAEVCQVDDAPAALAAMLSDRVRLGSMHRAALDQASVQDAGALADAIIQLADNGRT